MIHSAPKSSSLIAILFFLVLVTIVDVWLIISLLSDPSEYFILQLILIPVLLVIGITVAVKTYFGAVYLQLGKERISYRLPLGKEHRYKLKDDISWEEQVVKRKSSTYKQLRIQLPGRKKVTISNHESSNYEQVVNYLRRKIKN